ncbi:KilA-N domain-containing protein [Nostoc sp. CHAB 5784]|uniref:KilA-N domain-containing protein n=1 Tax=Nostoc mirabile TaxID=2907820 RepID=UPI001E506E05|nr:KilA-N domain-containing protein [Nostoc mirabile]MCC5670859.1 KilA-N domain-containing protein [Nostoc mirabile CHAB5784]
MLAHKWRDSEINQMPQSGQIGKYAIPKGYVNATQMAKANRKLLSDYIRLKSTKDYLQALGNDMGIPISSLIIEIEGYGKEQGTWVHSEIAIDLARWVSVPFRIWANRTLMKVMIASEIEPEYCPVVPILPPVEQRLHIFVQAMKTLAELTGDRLNPYIEQHCKDFVANLLAEHNQQALTSTQEKWLGVVNFAESELGKKVPLKGSHYRGHLGTWVRTFYPQLGDRQETRLVNGVQQPIYVYACHEPTVAAGLTKAIEEFFAHPSPSAALRQAGAFARKSLVTA